jgi:hypothetical protein
MLRRHIDACWLAGHDASTGKPIMAQLTADGNTSVLDTLASVMEDFDPAFNLATEPQ